MNNLTNKEIEELIIIAYQANNHARRMVNKYEPDNKYSQEKIKSRGGQAETVKPILKLLTGLSHTLCRERKQSEV